MKSPDPGVRRVAIHDLIAQAKPASSDVLLDHLARERDEKAVRLLIRHFRAERAAMPAFLKLYLDPATPVRAAHEAILAHDAMAPPGP